MSQYLIRLDDACPTMHRSNWQRIEEILDTYKVRPMVGIIPANQDPKQTLSPSDEKFWDKVKHWHGKGWTLALHGYDHCYISKDAGINPLWHRSEFAGVPLEIQREKIRNGVTVFRDNGFNPEYFFAPSHTFDENTLEALRLESDIRIISDTIANRPYKKEDFIFIPQLGGMPRKMPINGIWTFCLHPSTMTDVDFKHLIDFLEMHHKSFISFMNLSLDNTKRKNLLSKFLSTAYFTYRSLRGIK